MEDSGTAQVYGDEVGVGAVTSFGGGGGGRSWNAGGDGSSHGLFPFFRWCEVNKEATPGDRDK